MIRPPPRSTLFPSTTLFRSTQDTAATPRRRSSSHRRDTAPAVGSSGQAPIVTGEEDPLAHVPASDSAVPADRKSTRLNSSHANISYAVFCLKKKTLRFLRLC